MRLGLLSQTGALPQVDCILGGFQGSATHAWHTCVCSAVVSGAFPFSSPPHEHSLVYSCLLNSPVSSDSVPGCPWVCMKFQVGEGVSWVLSGSWPAESWPSSSRGSSPDKPCPCAPCCLPSWGHIGKTNGGLGPLESGVRLASPWEVLQATDLSLSSCTGTNARDPAPHFPVCTRAGWCLQSYSLCQEGAVPSTGWGARWALEFRATKGSPYVAWWGQASARHPPSQGPHWEPAVLFSPGRMS